jgi:alpha-tubulin suppressor-like RCC1 family protein
VGREEKEMKRTLVSMLVLIISLSMAAASAQNLRSEHLALLGGYVAAIQEDGTVKAAGNNDYGQCETASWRDVVAISACYFHTLGLKADGTVYAAGDNRSGECEVDNWNDIAMVVSATECSFGLKKDGSIVWAGKLKNKDKKVIKSWKNIVWIGFRWRNSLFAVDKQGKAYGVGVDFSRLENVVQVFEDVDHIFSFLLADGAMKLLIPSNGYSEVIDRDDPKWANVCEISDAGSYCMVLKRDGTVISDSAIAYFADWTDVVEIDGGLGVKSDGSILIEDEFVQHLTAEQLDEIRSWKVMVDPDTLPATDAGLAAP